MPNGMIPFGQGVPNRGTSEQWLDDWNRQFRASPIYRNWMTRNGLPTDGRVRLSRQQQSSLEAELRANGIQIPGGMHIDQGGNLNQKNRLVRNVAIGAAAGVGGYYALPYLAGSAGAGSGAAGSATGAGAGSLAPIAGGSPWAVTPYAGSAAMSPTGAAAVGGSIGAGAGAAGAIPGYTPGWEGNSNLLFGGSGASAGAMPPGYSPGWEGNTDIVGAGIDAADGARRYMGLTPREWLQLAGIGVGTAGSFMGNPSNLNPNTATEDPQLKRLLESMQGRIDKSEPLYDSIMAMANGLLPTQYQNGGRGGR